MKLCFYLLVVITLLSASGCVIREEHGEHWDHRWHDHEHEEHWDHDHDR